MLLVDDSVAAALRSHQVGRTRGVATYQGVSTPVQLAQQGSVTFDGTAQVQSTSSVTAIGFGNSLVPKTRTDPLAPTGQELALFRDVMRRDEVVATIPLGVFRITRAGDSVERVRKFWQTGRRRVLDWQVTLDLSDFFKRLVDDDFLTAEAPVPGNSVWQEVRRLSPIPVQQSLGDASVPPSTLYQSRIQAVTDLIGLIGGEPQLTRSGALTARLADAWMSVTVPAFDIEGTISWSDELTDDFYNQVVVSSTNDATLTAYRTITNDGDPLSVRRAGGRTTKQSAPIYTTQQAVEAAAETILARVSTRRSRTVTVECSPEALLCELGDVGWVHDTVADRAVFGEVTSMRYPLDPTMPVVLGLIVAEEA